MRGTASKANKWGYLPFTERKFTDMKKNIRKSIKRSISILTTIACLGTGVFTYVPGATVTESKVEITDVVSENNMDRDIAENNEVVYEMEPSLKEDFAVGDNGSLSLDLAADENDVISDNTPEENENAQEDEDNNTGNKVVDGVSLNQEEVTPELSYTVKDGCATITGYNGETSALVIQETIDGYPVTAIGNSAFKNNTVITSVSMPDSVTTIGNSAFYGCSGLSGKLELPEGLASIGTSAFHGCSGLSGTLVIPEKVAAIGSGSFYGCRGIKEIVFGNGLKNLYGYYDSYNNHYPSFYGCSGVEALTFQGADVPAIGGSTDITRFFGSISFSSLKTIYVPEGCYSRYSEAYGPNLQAQTRIRERGSEDFIIENGVLTAYTGAGEEIKVPEEVREIGKRAFQNNTALKHIELPSGLETIGEYAFSGCSALEGITIPGDVARIGNSAFYNCTGLTGELELPEGLTSIGSSAFYGCSGLGGDLVVPDTVTELGSSAFYGCSGFQGALALPGTLEKVNASTFRGCSGLSGELELPEGLTSIGSSAFYGCSGLSGDLVIPNTVAELGSLAFYGCRGFQGTLALSETLERINAQTFQGCSGLSGTLVIPEKVAAIGSGSFYGCRGIKEIVFGNGLKNLYGYYDSYNNHYPSFYGCSGVEALTFQGADVPAIGGSTDITRFFGSISFSSLKTIYTLQECLDKYKSAWGSYVPAKVTFSADTMSLPVSNVTAEYVYSHSIKLKWNPSVNKNVVGYYVYKDGERIADTTAPVFEEKALSSGTEYTYTITGHTDSGEETANAEIIVTTNLPAVTRIYTDNKLNKVGQSNGYIYALVKDSKNLEKGTGRFYYLDRNNEKIQIGDDLTNYVNKAGNGAVYKVEWDIAGIEPGSYTVMFEFTDRDGETNVLSETIIADNSRPEALSSLIATGDTNQIVLSWTIAHEIDTIKYYIYRRTEDEDDYTLIKKIYDRNTLTYTDTKAEKNMRSYYYIVGVNDFGQEGEPSNIAVAMPAADTEPPRVIQMAPANGSIVGGSVELYAQAQDNIAVTRTELYISLDNGGTWTQLKTTNDNYCKYTLETKKYEDSAISIKGAAYDANGNESTGLIYNYKIDNTGPEKVTGLSYESTASTVTLRWADVPDQDFSFFRVEQKLSDGSYKKIQDVYTTLGANISNLQSDTVYRYRVAAYDQLGNRGEASDVLEVRTQKDTTAPVVTSIKPDANYYNNQISARITASDNTGIASILIQTSDNAVIWENYKTVTFSGNNKTETASQTINLADFAEGYLYIRGIATDIAGNKSDDSKAAPYVQYIIDRTAPAAPENFRVDSITGAIELSWDMGKEDDLDGYKLYRSADGEKYSLLANNLYSVNYWDRSVEKGVTYYYRLAVCDIAGNESDKTEALARLLTDDTVKPEIKNYAPANGDTIGASKSTFSVMVSDNWKVNKVSVTYTVNEETDVRTLLNQQGMNTYYKVVNAQIPVSNLNDGDILHLTISVVDAQGLETVEKGITYTVDKTAPRVNHVAAKGDAEKIKITWSGNAEPDLAGYRVYRKTARGSYAMIAQRSAASSYEYNDYNAEPKETYYYKVEAVDKYGNAHARESEAAWLTVQPTAAARLNCESVLEQGVEYYFDASSSSADLGIDVYKFDFGDGTVTEGDRPKLIHKYSETGNYTITLTVTDKDGHAGVAQKKVTVEEAKMLGTIKVKTVDGNGRTLAGTPVYFDLDNTSENVKYADAEGYVTFAAGVGQYAVGAYKDGYLPVKKSVIVRANTETELELTLIEEPIVTGKFEVNRMTLDEIIAAGIDVSNPANQQVVKVTVRLEYGTQKSSMDIVTNGGSILSGGTTIIDTDEGKRKITANVVNIGTSSGSSGGAHTPAPEDVVIALLDVPIEASYLKEFFDVKLHIINHADTEFNLSNNEVTLNVPDGMSLVKAYGSNDSKTVRFASLAGQEKKTIAWTFRGDEAGEYNLSADYYAILDQFNAPVSAEFVTDTPIKVYGKQALKLIVDANYQIAHEAFYFDVSIQNIAEADMYLPNIEIADNIVTAYQEKVNTEADTEEDDDGTRKVRYLNSYVKNKSGYKEYIGTDAEVSTLEPGSRYTKQYVAYDAIDYEGIAYLREAVYEIANGLDIEVEINFSKTDAYSTDNADEKLLDIFKDSDRFSTVQKIMDKEVKYFYYYGQARQDDGDFLKKLGEAFHIASDAVFNLNIDGFTGENMKDITRNYVYEMLLDDAFQDAVENKIDNKYIEMTKNVLCVISSTVSDISDKNDIDAYNAMIKDGGNVRKLAKKWKDEGTDKFMDRLGKLCLSNGLSKLAVDKLNAVYHEDKLNGLGLYGAFGDAVSGACSELVSGLGMINDLSTAWNESAELTKQFITIRATQEEAIILMDMLLAHDEINGTVYKEIQEIRDGLEKGFATQKQSFINEIIDIAVEGMISKEITQVLKTVDAIYDVGNGVGVSTVYSAFKIAFNTFDYLFEWEDKVDELQKLRVAASMTYALYKEAIGTMNFEDSVRFFKALKYLIKMRIAGEKIYVDIAQKRDAGKALKAINGCNYTGRNDFETLDEYYNALLDDLLYDRDTIYSTTYSQLDIPDAPSATVDYVGKCTAEQFDEDYEYSFNGTNWITCDGGKIPIIPKNAGQKLWLRVKESNTNKAGNITKISILGKANILDSIQVTYTGREYHISGLSQGSYYYLLTNTYDGSVVVSADNELTVTNKNDIVLREKGEYKYLKLIKKAANFTSMNAYYGFDSNERTIFIDVDKKTMALTQENVELFQNNFTYNGNKIQVPSVLYKEEAQSRELVENSEYTVVFQKLADSTYVDIEPFDMIDAGIYKMIISGVGDYVGTIEKLIQVDPAEQNIAITGVPKKVSLDTAKFQLVVQGKMSKGKVNFSSDNENVAMVDAEGYVTICGAAAVPVTIKAVVAGDNNYKAAESSVAFIVNDKEDPSPTAAPTGTPGPTVTVTPTGIPIPTVTVTPTITPVPTAAPTGTSMPTITAAPTVTPIPTVTVTPTTIPAPTVTATPTGMPTSTVTVTPTVTPVPTVTAAPTGTSMPTITAAPTGMPISTVTVMPTVTPTPGAGETEKTYAFKEIEASVANGEATVSVSENDIDTLMQSAENSEQIALTLKIARTDNANRVVIGISKQALSNITSKAGASLRVMTALGTLGLDKQVLDTAVNITPADTVRLVMEREQADDDYKDMFGANVSVIKIFFLSGNTEITDIGVDKISIALPIPDALQGKNLAVAYVDADGKRVKLSGKVVTADDEGGFTEKEDGVSAGNDYYQFETPVLGELVLAEDAAVDAFIQNQDKRPTVTTIPRPKEAQNITNKYKGTIKKQVGTQLKQKVTGAKTKVTFSSSNPKVVKVGKNSGVITCTGVGKAVITSKAAGSSRYKAASGKITIYVIPKTVKVKSLKSRKKGQVEVISNAAAKGNDGYQFQYKHNGKTKNIKVISRKAAIKIFKKLKSGKKFEVRIRAYKRVGKKAYYGKYSKWKVLKKVK